MDKQPRHRGSNPENDKILSSETFRLAGCPYSRGVKLITHLHTVPSLRISGATPPLPPYAFMACTGTGLPYGQSIV
jgi:hypothetical protein